MSEREMSLRERLERRLIDKATRSETFRQELFALPVSVLNRELGEMTDGVQLPDTIDVRVLQETPNTIYLVLPPRFIASEPVELSEEELAVAAGAGRGERGIRTMCGIGPGGAVTWNFHPC
jgi:hypothetical protein